MKAVRIQGPEQSLDAVWLYPQSEPVAQVVLAHGAGAGFDHKTMRALATALAEQGIASLRFNFPFMQAGKRRVDTTPTAVAAIATAVAYARDEHALPLLVAGHSFGGRMASHGAALGAFECDGLVFMSFPLHPPKKPGTQRAAHLPDVDAPMLFLSGDRDDLAHAELLQSVVEPLPGARIHWLETANHAYVVLKRKRQNPQDVFAEIGEQTRGFIDEVC